MDVRTPLLSAMYIVETPEQVYSFDWDFVLPIIEELDRLGKRYLIAYSHYQNDTREGMPRNYVRFRLLASPRVLERFPQIEAKLLRNLRYKKGEDQFSLENQAAVYGITVEEMMRVFELWNDAARLKIQLIKLWQRGGGRSWVDGTHYALNTVGLVGLVQIPPITYPEEELFKRRNFPPKTNRTINCNE